MNFITKYAAIAALLIAPLSARAASSVLSVADHVNDSTIVYPESVETAVQQMLLMAVPQAGKDVYLQTARPAGEY